MLLLIISANWVFIFVCWEGVGIVSYLLINFWYTRRDSNLSAMQAIIVNRVGDWAFLLAIFGINLVIGNLDFLSSSCLFNVLSISNYSIYYINIVFLIAAAAKSAQLILHTWLPSAMAAPTPISSLLHAATMVTLGVYLLIRSSILLNGLSNILLIIFLIGTLTSLIAGITGFSQFDMKKVIAYSTSSQIGYMVTACGAQEYCIAFNHLINHAFFKAFLFINAGSIIHYLKDEQDFRNIGVLIKSNPYLHFAYLLGTLSLVAMPYYSGFYSKDLILENLAHTWTLALSGRIVYYLQLLTAVITTIYCFRSYFYIFLNQTSSSYIHIKETPILASILLSVPTLIAGYLFCDLFVGAGTSYWNGTSMIIFENEVEEDELLVISLLILFIGITIGYILSIQTQITRNPFVFDEVYNNLTVSYLFKEAKLMNQYIDKGVIEQLGYRSLNRSLNYLRYNLIDTGFLPQYLTSLLFAIVILVFLK